MSEISKSTALVLMAPLLLLSSCSSLNVTSNDEINIDGKPDISVIPAPESLSQYHEEFQNAIKDKVYPSIAVSVIDGGKIVWRDTYGMSDIASNRTAKVSDVYAVGSLSKSVTATIIMSMVEEGLIDLNAFAEDYLDVELMRDQPMTKPRVIDLIHMTGGIPHGHFSPDIGQSDEDHYVSKFAVQAFPAGKHLLYSNYSYGLLERIAERVDKKPFHVIVRDRVFSPLGMETARAEGLGNGPADTTLYDEEDNVIPPYEWRPVSGGGMSFSLLDLEKYVLFHMGLSQDSDSVLTGETREIMQTTYPKIEVPVMALGLGSLQISKTERLLMTSGAIAGGRSAAFMFPEKGDAVIFLTNSRGNSGEVEFTTVRMMDSLNPGSSDAAIAIVEAHGAIYEAKFNGNESFLGSWCGAFRATDGNIIDAKIEIGSNNEAIASFAGSEPEAVELSLNDTIVNASLYAGQNRVRFNLVIDDDKLIGSVVTTDKDADLINDIPHVGHMEKCQ